MSSCEQGHLPNCRRRLVPDPLVHLFLPFPAHAHLLAQQLYVFILSPSSSHKACRDLALTGWVCVLVHGNQLESQHSVG